MATHGKTAIATRGTPTEARCLLGIIEALLQLKTHADRLARGRFPMHPTKESVPTLFGVHGEWLCFPLFRNQFPCSQEFSSMFELSVSVCQRFPA